MRLEPWQQMVLDTLYELSDASFQERAWLHCSDDEVSSPTETVNQLFDDSGLSELLERGIVFSENADSALKQLSQLIDTIDFEQPIEVLLVDVRWPEVRQLAFQARNEVKAALHV